MMTANFQEWEKEGEDWGLERRSEVEVGAETVAEAVIAAEVEVAIEMEVGAEVESLCSDSVLELLEHLGLGYLQVSHFH